MEVVVLGGALGIVASVLTGGTFRRISDTPLRVPALAVLGAAVQASLALWAPAGGWSEPLAPALFGLSIACVAGFALANLHVVGMSVVALGAGLNLLVLGLNGAMPVRLEDGAADARVEALERSATHEPEGDGSRLRFLGQIVPVPAPIDRPVSFGDLILAVGLADVLFHAGRASTGRPTLMAPPGQQRRRRRKRQAGAGVPGSGASAEQVPAGDHPGQGRHDTSVVDAPPG